MKKMADGGFPSLINQKSKDDVQSDAAKLGKPMAYGGDMDMDGDDDGLIMNQMMKEHMDAVHSRDATKAHSSLKAMVHHIINSVEDEEEV